MAMQKEQGACFGRGFADVDTNGWLAKFKDWIIKPIGSGGPGWVMLRDASTLPVTQTIVAVDTITNILTVTGHPYKTGDQVQYQTTDTAIGGLIDTYSYIVSVVDVNNIQLSSGSGFDQRDVQRGVYANFSSTGVGTHTLILRGPFVVVAEGTPTDANDPKKILQVGYDTDTPGYVNVRALYAWDATEGNGLYNWGGLRIKTVDAGSFTYDFRGGEEFLCLQSYLASEPMWYHVMIDNWTGLTNFTDPPSVTGTLLTTLACNSAGPEVIQLTNSAEADLFTKNNWYFIYDFRDYCVRVTYAQCTGVGVADGLNADELQLENITALNYVSTKSGDTDNVLNTGSKICAYAHRYGFFGNSTHTDQSFQGLNMNTPYVDYNYDLSAHVVNNCEGIIYGGVQCSRDYDAIVEGNPQDNGTYIVQKPLIVAYYRENASSARTDGMSETWGEFDNAYLTSDAGMTKMSTGRIINEGGGDEEWVSLGSEDESVALGSLYIHFLIPNTESV